MSLAKRRSPPAARALAPAALLTLLALPVARVSAAPCPIGLPVAGEYSSGFGYRGRSFHPGVDLRAPVGTSVTAATGGTVVFAGRYYAYGLMLEIEHADGSRARYAHLARFAPGATVGTQLPAGAPIGSVGRTGRSSGPHLHVELRRNGRAVDPWPWLTRTACDDGSFGVAAAR